MSTKKEMKQNILIAFENSPHRWRTASSIAKEIDIPIKDVTNFLEKSIEIIKAKKTNTEGKALFAKKEKQSKNRQDIVKDKNEINYTDSHDKIKYLILMPYNGCFHELHNVLNKVLSGENCEILSLGDVSVGAIWVDEVYQHILNSDAVITDLTEINPNIMFELGIAHGLGKSLILLLNENSSSDLPTDLLGYQYLTYSPDNYSTLSTRLGKITQHLLARKGNSNG